MPSLQKGKGTVSVDPRAKGLYGQNGKPAWRVSEVANVSAGLVPVGRRLAASSLCHSSRRHEGLSPWSDDYQPGPLAPRRQVTLAARFAPGSFLATGPRFPKDKPRDGDAAGEGHNQNGLRLKAKWLAQLAKMVCATRQNDVRSWQNGLRLISIITDVLGKMICALICAWFAR